MYEAEYDDTCNQVADRVMENVEQEGGPISVEDIAYAQAQAECEGNPEIAEFLRGRMVEKGHEVHAFAEDVLQQYEKRKAYRDADGANPGELEALDDKFI